MKKVVDITPDTSLLPKLGKSGYSIPQAIAELVDNSIDAIRSKDDPKGVVKLQITTNSIKVIDTGSGMTEEQLTNSMRLAKSNKIDKLGKFGLGLKTAALSLGSSFQIVTKSKEENELHQVVYNEHKWNSTAQNWTIEIESNLANGLEPFTELTITELKSKIPLATLDKISIDMGERYAPYIESGEIQIIINGKKCEVKEPIIHPETKRVIEIPITIENQHIGNIIGWVALLKEGSNKGNYGFTTYWRNRMITRFDKIAIGEHPTISRIIGELHLDFLEPTHNKREFLKESPEYQEAEARLKIDLKDILSDAKKKSDDDTLTPLLHEKVEKFREATLEVLNNSPEFKEFTSKMFTSSTFRDDGGQDKFPFIIEKRKSGEGTDNPENESQPYQGARAPNQSHNALRKGIKIKGKYFEFKHSFQHLGVKESIKQVIVDDTKHNIHVFTNMDFPAFAISKDQSYYAFVNIADSLAEIYCKEIPGNLVGEIRELILRKASEYIIEEKP